MKEASITTKGFKVRPLAWVIFLMIAFCLVLTLGSGCDSDKEEKSQKKVEKKHRKKTREAGCGRSLDPGGNRPAEEGQGLGIFF